jgi:hypothetical protein
MKKIIIYKIIIYSLLTLFIFLSCKKDEEVIFGQGTTLKIEIKDEQGIAIEDEIAVHLYRDYDTYLSDLANQDPTNSIYQTTSTNLGVATFDDIAAGQVYYIYINYLGKAYQLNNFYFQFVLENPILSDAVTSIVIDLKPFNVGQIAFWTDQENLVSTGIEIFIGDSLIGSLDGVRNTVPTSIEDAQILPIFYQTTGSYTIQAKAANGCYWSQTIVVADDELLPFKLLQCNFGSVMFWAKPAVITTNGTLIFEISEEENTLESLTGSRTTEPLACDKNASDYLTIERPSGTYTYKATSAQSNCVWVGTFTVIEGCGEVIEITNCN